MPTLTAADAALSGALRLSVMRLARRLRAQRSDATLSLTQLSTLATLERHGTLRPGELAAHEKVQPPSMTRVVAALEAQGFVERRPHLTDGRQVVVSLTERGRALLREDRRRRDAWLSLRLHELSAADRALLRTAAPVLERLARS
ncbi:MAG: MarR family transcriptional regulator [Mycobacteriales bacterium]|jgi:DNA-binding MarR family transcriptional regulator